ncbi:MAG TPA: right-handed parallel beta-helix repeat-containing protein [Sphingomonas sp.]|nr:right-handed parallel beta-helix repeat-containing protein [Sphingomonas sp.]
MRWTILALLALAACGNAGKIESAKGGATVKLSGNQGILTLRGRSWSPAVTIDAANATFTGIVLDGVKGIHFKGGTVIGPGGKSYGIRILKSEDVAVEGMTITGAHRGIVIDRSQQLAIRNNQLISLISDGIDIASSQQVIVDRNSCSKFTPQMATFDASGVKHDGDHPDCIQAWTGAGQPPTSDLLITNNRADGMMQGVFLEGPPDGSSSRFTIRNNDLRVAMSNAVSVSNLRDVIIRDNRVSTVPGARQIRDQSLVKANINVRSSLGIVCGNQVNDVPSNLANKGC